MTPELHAHIKHELSELAANRIRNTALGICWHVCDTLFGRAQTAAAMWLRDTATKWPEFSGNIAYPVPSTTDAPDTAYWVDNIWIGEYGATRQRLVAFLLDNLEQDSES